MPETLIRAGGALDALILERVLGYQRHEGEAIPELPGERLELRHKNEPLHTQVVWRRGRGEYYCKLCGNVPAYSTEIAEAWSLVGLFQRAGWYVSLIHPDLSMLYPDGGQWEANFVCFRRIRPDGTIPTGRGDGDTAALAICRAALAGAGDLDRAGDPA